MLNFCLGTFRGVKTEQFLFPWQEFLRNEKPFQCMIKKKKKKPLRWPEHIGQSHVSSSADI